MTKLKFRGKLLTCNNPKAQHTIENSGWLPAMLYLAPSTSGGRDDLCPYASPGCRRACLWTAGRGQLLRVQQSRVRRSQWFYDDHDSFMRTLYKDITALERLAKRTGLKLCVRLNATSDILWERESIIEDHPHIQFYDYTKWPIFDRIDNITRERIPNYYLVFSRSEINENVAINHLVYGYNVTVVFRDELPLVWKGYPVVDGDKSDARFLETRELTGVVIGLHAKGKAKYDTSGFVVG